MFVSGLNWHAIHIEASPFNTVELRKKRPESVNLHAAICGNTRLLTFVSKPGSPSYLGAVGGLWELMPCVLKGGGKGGGGTERE